MKRNLHIAVCALILFCCFAVPLSAQDKNKQPSKFLNFFYRTGLYIDRFLLQNIDTNYICLPEHSWQLTYTNGFVGIVSNYTARNTDYVGDITINSQTTPSLDLGLYTAYRGLGFSYSWDGLHAYAQKMNLSLGSKFIGIDFSHQRSTNIKSKIFVPKIISEPRDIGDGYVAITNTNLSLWYALNSKHYSHNAAVKQNYVQKKTAGSLTLHASYMATEIAFVDSMYLGVVLDSVSRLKTHQAAVGLGYGINYTPNQGKLLFHLSAAAKLVVYSINMISYIPDEEAKSFETEKYALIHPEVPVHVTGTMRAAISWDINRWVYLSARATVDNMRFQAVAQDASLAMSNWNWQVNVSVGVRLGAGKKQVAKSLGADYDELTRLPKLPNALTKFPQWVTDFFLSP